MSANQTVDPEEIAELIGRCKLATSVSEFHGSLVGFISAGGHLSSQDSLLSALAFQADPVPTADEQAMLARLRHQTEAWLADTDLTFEPWLPEEDASLGERTNGLVDWTRGFLGGFGLGGTPETAKLLTEEAQEVLPGIVVVRVEQAIRQGEPVARRKLTRQGGRHRALEVAMKLGLGNHEKPLK